MGLVWRTIDYKTYSRINQMQKGKKIAYWIATLWLALGMVSTGIVQLMQMEEEVQKFNELGYPTYLMTLLGIWKILGTIAILLPRFTILKEWAYAGFFLPCRERHYHIFKFTTAWQRLPLHFYFYPLLLFPGILDQIAEKYYIKTHRSQT